jgi:hypothetical protein
MTILRELGDGVEGERLWAEFRKMSKPILTHKTGAHRAQRAKLEGLPAIVVVEKLMRARAYP